MTTKTEDQAEKDKAAVQKMVGAKTAMEAAIRRIERLESALRVAKSRIEQMQTAHGDRLGFRVHDGNGWKFISATEFTQKAIYEINAAL